MCTRQTLLEVSIFFSLDRWYLSYVYIYPWCHNFLCFVYIYTPINIYINNLYMSIFQLRNLCACIRKHKPTHQLRFSGYISPMISILCTYINEKRFITFFWWLALHCFLICTLNLFCLGRKLSLASADVDRIKEDYRNRGFKEVVFQMLLSWKRKDTNVTIEDLVKVLCDSKMEECAIAIKSSSYAW